MKFHKLVEVGPVALEPWAEQELEQYANEIIRYDTLPETNEEIIKCIGGADAVLVRTYPKIDAEVLAAVPNVKYIGMSCSLYSKESANVDIAYAEAHGITVSGIRDYGDQGVTEYVIYQLVRILHGYDYPMWQERSLELTRLKVGFVGMGTSGRQTAAALKMLGADISYFARSVKSDLEEAGIHYKELHTLLEESQVVITCLNKNVILLGAEEFAKLGNGKIMINTSIGPAADLACLKEWCSHSDNIFCSDTKDGLGTEIAEEFMQLPNVICTDASAGMTAQAYDLLSRKVLDNIKAYLQV